jgi:rubrerythrin
MNGTREMAYAFAALRRAAARKRVYAVRAESRGRRAAARLLRAMGASEEVQARRLFNNLKGRIDLSEDFLDTVFSKELEEILAEYDRQLQLAKAGGRELQVQVLGELRRAELRLRAFYDPQRRDLKVSGDERYYLCPFCGYLATGTVPEVCPVCGAAGENFQETG